MITKCREMIPGKFLKLKPDRYVLKHSQERKEPIAAAGSWEQACWHLSSLMRIRHNRWKVLYKRGCWSNGMGVKFNTDIHTFQFHARYQKGTLQRNMPSWGGKTILTLKVWQQIIHLTPMYASLHNHKPTSPPKPHCVQPATLDLLQLGGVYVWKSF